LLDVTKQAPALLLRADAMTSIRRKLLLALLAAMSAVMLLAAFATYRVAENQVNAMFDEQLRQLGLSMRDPMFFGTLPAQIGNDEDSDYVIQVWSNEGETLYYSRPHRVLPDRAQLGLATVDTPNGAWRVFALQQHGKTIQVAQPMEVRENRAAAAALRTLTPYLVSLPVLALLIWFIVGRGLHPLNRIALSVQSRTPASLTPLDAGDAPDEVRGLVDAVNDLLARLQTALEAQRAFVADAAHELRTPLTALQLQVQVADRATNDNDRRVAMADLMAGLHRTSHAVQQLLTLARSESAPIIEPTTPVNLLEQARAAVVEHQPLAAAKHIDLGLADDAIDATMAGDADGIRIMLANLISNAVRYTPDGGRVDILTGIDRGRPYLLVDDNGPGIPPAEREHVFARFYRRPGERENGSGLGLAIVKAVAARHRADVALTTSPAQGLRVAVHFPAAIPQPDQANNKETPWPQVDSSRPSSAGAC
jgi:two-component system, OmpR family, sensor kinase